MIQRVEISGIHVDINRDLQKYITKKLSKLEKYIPRHARAAAHAEVKLSEVKTKTKKKCHCEIVLHLPSEIMAAEESTVNMYAAVDIVQAKLKVQLQKYKAKRVDKKQSRATAGVRSLLGKIRSR